MKRLWAPWRMIYIKGLDEEEGCIFCKKSKEGEEEKNLVLFRGKTCFVLLNLFPYNSGHLMAAPFRHLGELNELTDEEGLELFHLVQHSLKVLKDVLKPDGFNVGMNLGRTAGAGYEDHVHVHIVPRWNGDTNFMPVISDTKVVPQALRETYKALHPAFTELEGIV